MIGNLKSGFYKHPSDQRAKELWAKVEQFQIDEPGAAVPFSARLAREQGWTIKLALEAIEEYKRFMFLAVASGHGVTPSATVDEVWHLHLIYTRSYWEEFCVKVLDRIIHHDPGSGKEGEKTTFVDQYQKTLESYTRFFGPPPKAIWGNHNGHNVRLRNAPILDLPPGADCTYPS
jgi:hypothetical protein